MIYLAGAYGVIWLALFLYMILIDRKASKLSDELETLRKGHRAD